MEGAQPFPTLNFYTYKTTIYEAAAAYDKINRSFYSDEPLERVAIETFKRDLSKHIKNLHEIKRVIEHYRLRISVNKKNQKTRYCILISALASTYCVFGIIMSLFQKVIKPDTKKNQAPLTRQDLDTILLFVSLFFTCMFTYQLYSSKLLKQKLYKYNNVLDLVDTRIKQIHTIISVQLTPNPLTTKQS